MENRRPATAHAKTKSQPRSPRSEIAKMRWLVLLAGLGLIALALVLRLQPSLLSKDSALASDMLGKVGIVFLCGWLAWPAIETFCGWTFGVQPKDAIHYRPIFGRRRSACHSIEPNPKPATLASWRAAR
jgi:hypothetical protein